MERVEYFTGKCGKGIGYVRYEITFISLVLLTSI